jgi:hypothetical protein
MYISGHAFGITTDIDVSTFGDHVPDFRCLEMDKGKNCEPLGRLEGNRSLSEKGQLDYFLCHFVLHIFLSRALTREGENQLRQCSLLKEIVQLILIDEVLQNHNYVSYSIKLKILVLSGSSVWCVPSCYFCIQRRTQMDQAQLQILFELVSPGIMGKIYMLET